VTTVFEYDLASFISFRDRAACERVRGIKREELERHPNPDFRIRVIDSPGQFYRAFAGDIVTRIRRARDEGRQFVGIFPVGPMPQYELAARTINEERLSLRHVHTFNMDEYASEDGVTAPLSWPGSFQRAMWERFFDLVDAELRPPAEQIHFPPRRRSETTRSGSKTWAAPTSATAASAGVATSRSGNRTSASSSTATSRPTSGPAPGSSSCTR
jgi:glucosamine-6-phosphate deaminase